MATSQTRLVDLYSLDPIAAKRAVKPIEVRGTVIEIDKRYKDRLGIHPDASILHFVDIYHDSIPVEDHQTITAIEGEQTKPRKSKAGRKQHRRPAIKRTYDHIKRIGVCDQCQTHEHILFDSNRAEIVCSMCGLVKEQVVDGKDQNGFSHTDFRHRLFTKRARTATTPCYEHKSHFRDILMQCLAEENMTTMPPNLIEDMHEHIHIHNIDMKTFTPGTCYRILHEMGLTHLYKHKVKLTYMLLKDKKPPTLTQAQIKTLYADFDRVKELWDMIRNHPDHPRKNLLSYSYILFKLCEIHEWYDVCEVSYLLKTNSKLNNLDESWFKICTIANWPFIPSPSFNEHFKG
jgi:hypothetical protein